MRHDLSQMQQAEQGWMFSSPVAPYSNMGYRFLAHSVIAQIPLDAPSAIERRVQLWFDLARVFQTSSERLRVHAVLGRRLAQPASSPH